MENVWIEDEIAVSFTFEWSINIQQTEEKTIKQIYSDPFDA